MKKIFEIKNSELFKSKQLTIEIDEMRINLFMNKNFVGAIPHRTELDEIKAKINFDGTGVHFVLENMVNNEIIFSTYFASNVFYFDRWQFIKRADGSVVVKRR